MSRFHIVSLVAVALLLAGCKTSSPLAKSEARTAIANGIFTDAAATQTATFDSGAIASQPLAIAQFLFAKHWTACATETGALASPPTCSLDAEGVSYGRANRWTSTAAPTPSCATCATWTIPLAKAVLRSIDSVDATDKTHAAVAFTFDVVPNEFGRSFGEWTASHAVAWCGPDPVAVGGWGAPRHATAQFLKGDAGWALANPPGSTFVATFANETAAAKPCAR
jgi:hypothetical protein